MRLMKKIILLLCLVLLGGCETDKQRRERFAHELQVAQVYATAQAKAAIEKAKAWASAWENIAIVGVIGGGISLAWYLLLQFRVAVITVRTEALRESLPHLEPQAQRMAVKALAGPNSRHLLEHNGNG